MVRRLPDLHRRFQDITIGFFQKHGIRMVWFWTNEIGGPNDQIIYMLAYEGLADREKKWGAFLADPDRVAKFAETEKSGPLVRRLTAQILRPTPYSSISRSSPAEKHARGTKPRAIDFRPVGSHAEHARTMLE